MSGRAVVVCQIGSEQRNLYLCHLFLVEKWKTADDGLVGAHCIPIRLRAFGIPSKPDRQAA
jgi:hypothetical protein